MSMNSSAMKLAVIFPSAPTAARMKTGIFKRNVRKAEREMLVHTELAFTLRDRFPLFMNLLTVARTASKLITGL